jgi:hypothetical protein
MENNTYKSPPAFIKKLKILPATYAISYENQYTV